MSSPVALFLGIATVVAPCLASGADPQKATTDVAAPTEAAGKTPSGVAPNPAKKPTEVPSDLAAPPKQASKTASGLAYLRLHKGQGKRHPRASDRVRVHYSGWTTSGRMFDSSVARGEPAEFRLDAVIKGWTEGLQRMVVGDKTRFWIPAELAYGDSPRRPGLPAGMLIFDVELLDIKSDK
jgi:FKBP-type peptidyl-prolyl cis-trans isomerase